MSTITEHYNVAVKSRFYLFLEENREFEDPKALIESAVKKREEIKETKSKAKKEKEKHVKQVAVAKKEAQTEVIAEKLSKTEEPEVEIQPELIGEEDNTGLTETITDETKENRPEKSPRVRSNYKRGNRVGSNKSENKPQNDEQLQKTQNEFPQKSFGSNRGRPYRRERIDEREDSFKVGYFEEHQQQQSGYRGGGGERRRPYGRGVRSSGGTTRVRNEEFSVQPDDMNDTYEEHVDRPASRGYRGRYPRPYRGSINRFQPPNVEEGMEFENSRIGYFDENSDNREYRSRGRPRGNRGPRRGRGDYRGPREHDNVENPDDSHCKTDNQAASPIDNWESVKEEHENAQDESPVLEGSNGLAPGNEKSADWGEIEDDPAEVKVDLKATMTLEEWKALNSKDRIVNQTTDGKEIRKANDGQDVFSGMSEYRKGKSAEEQGEEHENVHETVPVRQKQSIPMAVRFSRHTDSSDTNIMESGNADSSRNYQRTFVPRGGREYQSGGGRGRSRGGADFGSQGREYYDQYNNKQQEGGGGDQEGYNRGGDQYEGRRRGGGEFEGRRRGGGEFDGRRRGGGEFDGPRRGGGEYDGRRRGGGESEGQRRGGGEFDGQRRGSGEYDGRRRGGGEFEGQRRGGGEFEGQRRGGEFDGQRRGGGEFDGQRRGGGEYDGRRRGGGEFEGQRRGGEFEGQRRGGEFEGSRRGGGEYEGRRRGGGDFERRRGGGEIESRRNKTLDNEGQKNEEGEFSDRPVVSSEFEANGKEDQELSRPSRGGYDSNSRGRGSYDYDSRGRGSSDFNRRGRGGGDFNRRGRGSSDFNNYGRGRDFNRGRGRGNRSPQHEGNVKEDDSAGININLGNEEEFPHLS